MREQKRRCGQEQESSADPCVTSRYARGVCRGALGVSADAGKRQDRSLPVGPHRRASRHGRAISTAAASRVNTATSTSAGSHRLAHRFLEGRRGQARRGETDIRSGLPRSVRSRNSLWRRWLTCVYALGVLSCLDGYMNIALEQTEEHVNGVVTNRYGDAFIRGNNGAS